MVGCEPLALRHAVADVKSLSGCAHTFYNILFVCVTVTHPTLDRDITVDRGVDVFICSRDVDGFRSNFLVNFSSPLYHGTHVRVTILQYCTGRTSKQVIFLFDVVMSLIFFKNKKSTSEIDIHTIWVQGI